MNGAAKTPEAAREAFSRGITAPAATNHVDDSIEDLFAEVRTSDYPDATRRRIAPLLTDAIAEQQAVWLEMRASRQEG